ncbi:MAG TPA: hypothetical protein VLG47_06205 [Candidatus Saccharimonadales bacterium]|nr:hypothetical protein [Candidatus Saccharimonadales bacterium]
MTDHNQYPGQSIPVDGAFEVFEGNRENLITLTRNGELLQVGDQLPPIPGINPDGVPFILHTVNAFGTPTCDRCTDMLEAFHRDHPDVPIYSLTKQEPEQMRTENEDESPITHDRIQIDQNTAIDLGVELAPGEGADTEFWPTALRRTVAVIGGDGRILHIEQPDDQEQFPNFDALYDAVLAA